MVGESQVLDLALRAELAFRRYVNIGYPVITDAMLLIAVFRRRLNAQPRTRQSQSQILTQHGATISTQQTILELHALLVHLERILWRA